MNFFSFLLKEASQKINRYVFLEYVDAPHIDPIVSYRNSHSDIFGGVPEPSRCCCLCSLDRYTLSSHPYETFDTRMNSIAREG